MSRTDILNKIATYKKTIKEHEDKKKAAYGSPQNIAERIRHLDGEINDMKRDILKLESQLTKIPEELYCYKCNKTVVANHYKCPKCDTYLR